MTAIYRGLYPRLLRYFTVMEPSEAEDLASETWLDVATGLTWQAGFAPQSLDWADASAYCASLAGGFRLPGLKELLSIVDLTAPYDGDLSAFPGSPHDLYWTSAASSPSQAFGI